MATSIRLIRFPVFTSEDYETFALPVSAFINMPKEVDILDQHKPNAVLCQGTTYIAGNTIICEARVPSVFYTRYVGIGYKTIQDSTTDGKRMVSEAEITEVSLLLAPNPYQAQQVLGNILTYV